MSYKLKTAPGSEPLTTAEVLHHLVETSDDGNNDAYVDRITLAARKLVEKYTRRQLISATWYRYLDVFPPWDYQGYVTIDLEKSPVTAVSSVKYYDEDNELQSLEENTDYYVDLVSEPARIRIENVPSIYEKPNAVVIEFVAGFANADAVPETIKQAMLVLIGHMYENRQEEVTGTIVSKLGKGFEWLLQFDDVSQF